MTKEERERMTKDEITLNQLKLGEVIEDAAGKMWLVSCIYKRGNVYLACLSGKRIDAWGEFFPQACLNDALHITIEPLGVYSTDWMAKDVDLSYGIYSFCRLGRRRWEKLLPTRKVTIEVEVDLDTGRGAAKNKGIER